MAKKKFITPFVLLDLVDGGDVEVEGGGTGQSSTDLYPVSFDDWKTMWGEDYNDDGSTDAYDYAAWWGGQEYPKSLWEEYNPGLPWSDYFDEE